MNRYSSIAAKSLLVLIAVGPMAGFAQESAISASQDPLERFPKNVATVNGKTISRDQLAQECLKRYGTIVLDNLLNKYLIKQACDAKGIQITQKQVNDEIERIAAKVGLQVGQFLQTLEEERDILPEQYASEIVWPMLALRALAADQIQVKPEEIENALRNEYGPKVQVRMIAVSERQKADSIHAAATKAPETFRRLAKEYSEDAPSASVEGLLPPVRHHAEEGLFEQIAFQLKPNEISPVFPVGEMHVILQCVRHREASFPSPDMLPMIRSRIQEHLRDQRLGLAADSIFEKLKTESQIVQVIGKKDMEAKYPGVAAYINRAPVPVTMLAAECISRHGREILRGEISRLLLDSALDSHGKQVERADIDREIARAADMGGYLKPNGTPDVEAWLQHVTSEEGATIDLYVSDAVWPSVALKKLVEDTVTIDDEDLRKGFENNYGPRAEVLAIVLSNQRTAQDVFAEARANLTEQAFGELAAKYSVEPVSRSNFGKIPPIRKNGGRPTLETAAFELLPGQISGVIAWGEQYAILYKQGETDPIVTEFEAVRDELTKEIREKKLRHEMGRYLDKMLASAEIVNLLEGTTQTGVQPASASQSANGQQVVPAGNR